MLAGKCGLAVHDDIALPPLALTHVVEDRDAAWRLHDLAEAAAERGAKFGQPAGQAALGQRGILRTIVAINARRCCSEEASSVRRGDGFGSYFPPLQAGSLFLHVSVD